MRDHLTRREWYLEGEGRVVKTSNRDLVRRRDRGAFGREEGDLAFVHPHPIK